MIEQMGENFATRVGISLAAMTYDAFEKIESFDHFQVGVSFINKQNDC